MPKRSAAFALLLFLASPAFASSSGRAFTLDDLFRVKSVAAPAISPDGKTVIYSVSTNADVFIVPLAGDAAALASPRNLVSGR